MSRKEFMEQLERLLRELPEQERREALEYYDGYFDDAGEEQEAAVIQELGSPGKVAAMILADLKGTHQETYGEYTEYGYSDQRFDSRNMPENPQAVYEEEQEKSRQQQENNWDGTRYYDAGSTEHRYHGPFEHTGSGNTGSGYGKQGKYPRKKGSMWILIVILIILGSPVWGGIGLGLLGGLLGLVLGLLGLFIGLAAGGAGMVIGGIVMLVWTFLVQFSSPATAVASAGGAFLLTALGLLFLTVFLWLLLQAMPAVFRCCVDLIQRILYRGRRGGDRK